jgi:hypothetical protein
VICQLPAGLNFPLQINFLDLLTISNTTDYKATINIADLEALYSPRPPATTAYQAIPKNPSWLRYEESSADFSAGGSTVLTGGNADLLASDPGSAGASVIAAITKRLPTLAPQAQPNVVQALGDMSGDGLLPDLQYAKSELATLGSTSYDAVGGDEITGGSNAENANFTQVFGDTHYAYTDGSANVIVTDSSHGGLLASDAYQVPAVTSQYPWLVQELSDNTSPVVVVATQEPAYDPHSPAASQFSDRWEAQMYLQLVDRYQQTHRNAHVVMLYGGASGVAEQILNPQGQAVTAGQGIPQLTVADLGASASAPADQGGFSNFALLHATTSGGLQFTVEPVLTSIAIAAPGALTVGQKETLTATGTTVGGDNDPAITMPVADPASHAWSSSDAKVASVDAVSGVVTAHRPGTATISVTSGGVTAAVTMTVSR